MKLLEHTYIIIIIYRHNDILKCNVFDNKIIFEFSNFRDFEEFYKKNIESVKIF